MSITNTFTERLSDSETVTNVDTDASGQFTVTLGELRQIESAADVEASANGGYLVNPISVSENSVTLEVRQSAQGGTSAAPLPLVTGATDLTDVNIRAEGY